MLSAPNQDEEEPDGSRQQVVDGFYANWLAPVQ
jgi:hypothetical protein